MDSMKIKLFNDYQKAIEFKHTKLYAQLYDYTKRGKNRDFYIMEMKAREEYFDEVQAELFPYMIIWAE